ncbi:Ubiquitin-like domain-containing protein [Caenorhabditis elegans]|uniref:Ubiquitin-like domain-containing protein n=1 Tax=Caenorhabditis elegans TaxID=6239 RepID=Q93559_CAEEL|nr:Ubiquitin-like domain-containing protein [Caenorhabditis elegans]CAB01694.2 Ubiquitin-like domain-containing protein [Caenorhabditis elegans]|eukprot:NP_492722.2 Uncharacterized protein CELE_F25D7.2 [Caenorhabditis elegans]
MTEDINVVPEQVSPSDDVELTIRQAYQAESDLKFSCPTSWTIKEVKEHVKNCLNNHPEVVTQRLIFSGASLNNEQVLADVLRERNHVAGEQIFFHLMIAQPYQQTTPTADVRRRNVNNTASNQNSASGSALNEYAQNMVAWQQYWNAYNQLSPEAQVSEHQRLMAHYYTYASTTPAAPIYQVPANQQLQQNAVAWRIRVQGVAAPARANGNQGAAAPRQGRVDILEVGYRIFKVVLLFSAILLYSSFERFALVLCSALFIYFIQLRRNHARNRVQAQAAAAAAQQANNQEPHVNNNNNGENDGDNTAPTTEGETPATSDAPVEPPAPQPTGMQVFIATLYSFVTSFFASLVPDHPMPMDLN